MYLFLVFFSSERNSTCSNKDANCGSISKSNISRGEESNEQRYKSPITFAWGSSQSFEMLSKIGMVLFVAAVFNRAVRSAEEADVDSPVEESKKNFKFETITEYLTHINQLQDHL